MTGLQKLHLLTGSVGFFLFLVTGAYMNNNFPVLYDGDDMVRMMYRANHIYLLLASLVHVMCGLSMPIASSNRWCWIQGLGSALLVIGFVLLLVAFY